MTMRDARHSETLAEVQRLLARARPEQLRRLLAEIEAADPWSDRDDSASPQGRVS